MIEFVVEAVVARGNGFLVAGTKAEASDVNMALCWCCCLGISNKVVDMVDDGWIRCVWLM